MNLLDLLRDDGFTMTRITDGEFAGRCPWCGGVDRLCVWPFKDKEGGRFWCRRCTKSGDGIEYLRDYRGMTYQEGRKMIMGNSNVTIFPSLQGGSPGSCSLQDSTPALPPDRWRQVAEQFLNYCQNILWSDSGIEVREFLHARGIDDSSIKRAGLGWNGNDVYDSRERWGLPTLIKDNGKKTKLKIPRGLVIPCFASESGEGKDHGLPYDDWKDQVARLRIRLPEPKENQQRYHLVAGSSLEPTAWNLDRDAIIIVESDLDGILIQQVAGDLVGIMALGSTTGKPSAWQEEKLRTARLLLLALDYDDAGIECSWEWSRRYPNSRIWPSLIGKDCGEDFEHGVDIRHWVETGLMKYQDMAGSPETEIERWCIANENLSGGETDFPGNE